MCQALERKLPLNACGCQAMLPCWGMPVNYRAFAPVGPCHTAGAQAKDNEVPEAQHGGFG